MGFVKGDPNINRKGRPKNAEIDALRVALNKEGEKRGIDFWTQVAKFAFTNDKIMMAIIKKFIPDLTHTEIEGTLEGGQKVVVFVQEAHAQNQGGEGRLPVQVSVVES